MKRDASYISWSGNKTFQLKVSFGKLNVTSAVRLINLRYNFWTSRIFIPGTWTEPEPEQKTGRKDR